MAVPKKKTSKSRRNMRRAHLALPSFGGLYRKCANCGLVKLQHLCCSGCGFYKGRKVRGVANLLDLQTRRKMREEKKKVQADEG